MVTITTDFGVFTADDERSALRAARAGKREEEKRRAAESAARAKATRDAQANGFQVLCAAAGTRRLGYSVIVRPGENWWAQYVRQDVDNPRKWFVQSTWEESTGVVEFYGYRPTAILVRPSGDCACVWIVNDDPMRSETSAMAIGHSDGLATVEELPGSIRPDDVVVPSND